MTRTLIQAVAAGALLVFLWKLFRMAMGLRAARLEREGARTLEEGSGRTIVAEIPSADGSLVFFVEDAREFRWGREAVVKAHIAGARLLLNGGVIAQAFRAGVVLPEPAGAEEYEGRERWDVRLHLSAGALREVPCGTLREGVSRDAGRRVFDAVRTVIDRAEGGA